jgi:hypothetical protein
MKQDEYNSKILIMGFCGKGQLEYGDIIKESKL